MDKENDWEDLLCDVQRRRWQHACRARLGLPSGALASGSQGAPLAWAGPQNVPSARPYPEPARRHTRNKQAHRSCTDRRAGLQNQSIKERPPHTLSQAHRSHTGRRAGPFAPRPSWGPGAGTRGTRSPPSAGGREMQRRSQVGVGWRAYWRAAQHWETCSDCTLCCAAAGGDGQQRTNCTTQQGSPCAGWPCLPR